MLRAMARQVRETASREAAARRDKAACVMVAANGLGLLRRKLGRDG